VAAATGLSAALTSGWSIAAVGVALAAGTLVAADRMRAPHEEREPAIATRAETPPAPPPTTRPPPTADEDELGEDAPAVVPDPTPAQHAAAGRAAPSPGPNDETTPGDQPSAPASALAIENELLGRAASALREGRADAAIRITSEHARRFPRSPLTDLRAALRIEALCALHKRAQARGEARLFRREHAGSPLLQRIEKSCGAAP
jgi:hypothetical protein